MSRSSSLWIFALLLAGSARGAGPDLDLDSIKNPIRRILESGETEIDTRGDGKIDLRRTFDSKGEIVKLEQDRNHDGKTDLKMERPEEDRYVYLRDNDFNGSFEEKTVQEYERGQLMSETVEAPELRVERTYDHARNVMIELTTRGKKGSLRKIPIKILTPSP